MLKLKKQEKKADDIIREETKIKATLSIKLPGPLIEHLDLKKVVKILLAEEDR
jgi:hypothetical protein